MTPGFFTRRELVVIQSILSGNTVNKLIARHLGRTQATVTTHLRNINEKTGVRDKTELVLWLRKQGFLDGEDTKLLDWLEVRLRHQDTAGILYDVAFRCCSLRAAINRRMNAQPWSPSGTRDTNRAPLANGVRSGDGSGDCSWHGD